MAEETRAAFEKWVKDEMPTVSLQRDSNYWNCFVENAWEAWKACERHCRAAQTAESTPPTCGCCSIMLQELMEFTQCPADEDLVAHIKNLLAGTQTPGEKCPPERPNCDYTGAPSLDSWQLCRCPTCQTYAGMLFNWLSEWHSPAPAPQKDGTIRPHCMGTEFPKK